MEEQTNIGNISKAHRERLLAEVAAIKSFLEQSGDKHATRLLSFAADLEKEVRGRKFGLIFEEHRERVDAELEANIPVLEEVKERFLATQNAKGAKRGNVANVKILPVANTSCQLDNGNIGNNGNIQQNSPPLNFLIEGDNLAALKLLEKTHRGKIDLIYIDPPYNTGNKDFIYNDSYVDKTDTFRHSKWLSFMRKRLEIAKRLMTDKGVIFISIDDNEQAALKLLCDEVFGYGNFVADIAWQRTYSIRNDSKGIPSEVEHILVYSHSSNWQPYKLPRTAGMDELYKNPDNDVMPWTSSSCSAPGASTHQGMVYAIQHPFTGNLMYPSTGRCWTLGQDGMLENMNKWCEYELRDIDDAAKRAEVCGISKSAVKKNVQAIMLKGTLEASKKKAKQILEKGPWPYFYFTNGGKGGLRRKTYISNVGGRISTNFFSSDEAGHTDEAKKEIIALFGGNAVFDTPKPVRLLERILRIASESGSTILDFFAGSGTTGHAVMKLNAEDGGKRKFILVTNNENEICEKVTYERLKRVMEKEGYAASLKYFKIGFVPIGEEGYWDMADALLGHIRELVELENGIDFDHDKSVAIVLTDEELGRFVEDISATKNTKGAMGAKGAKAVAAGEPPALPEPLTPRQDVRVLYKGHNVILGAKAKAVLERRGVRIETIPDYYYPELDN